MMLLDSYCDIPAFLGAVARKKKREGASDVEIDRAIGELVSIFKDPIIVYGTWGEELPEEIRHRITIERMLQMLKAKGKPIEEATDAEAAAYLYTLSLAGPIPSYWVDIYLYLGNKIFGEKIDFAPQKLSQDEQHYLDRLKRDIYRSRKKRKKSDS